MSDFEKKFGITSAAAWHDIGNRLAQWRKDRGWTQGRLAQETGVSIPTIRRLETGQPISEGIVRTLCGNGGIDLDWLLRGELQLGQGENCDPPEVQRLVAAGIKPPLNPQARAMGRAIAAHRAQAKLAQAEVARRSGISVSYLQKIEGGYEVPADETTQRIMAALGVAESSESPAYSAEDSRPQVAAKVRMALAEGLKMRDDPVQWEMIVTAAKQWGVHPHAQLALVVMSKLRIEG